MAHKNDLVAVKLIMNDGRIISAEISAVVLRNLVWYFEHNIFIPIFVQEGVSLAGTSNAKIADIHVIEYQAPP